MTLFAVACAGLFPLLHTGRPWLAYWLFPYPNTMGIQPQFRSPLMWDVFAISTYGTVSALFWYTGDRKSTRLNSSHANISYAVFCLKKNKANFMSQLGVSISTFTLH